MTLPRLRLVVVGGGILGTMHALEGARRGFDVLQLERHDMPRGASVRNFGLIWVSGRAAGAELELALLARQRWEEISLAVPQAGFRAVGSLTVARTQDELEVLELAAELPDAAARGFELMSADQTRERNPALAGELVGALFCSQDAIIEPRLVLGALRGFLESTGTYRYVPNRTIVGIGPHYVLDQTGERHQGDLLIVCPGPARLPFLEDDLLDAPLRRVRLQMLETAPYEGEMSTAVADGDSLRYYPAFADLRDRLAPQVEVASDWRAQLLMVRRLSGHLTIGDTHRVTEPFDFDIADEPYDHLLGVAGSLLGKELPRVERRWAGVYSEVTDPKLLYFRKQVEDGVFIVTGPGGRGMTMSPGIAEESFT